MEYDKGALWDGESHPFFDKRKILWNLKNIIKQRQFFKSQVFIICRGIIKTRHIKWYRWNFTLYAVKVRNIFLNERKKVKNTWMLTDLEEMSKDVEWCEKWLLSDCYITQFWQPFLIYFSLWCFKERHSKEKNYICIKESA